MSSVVEGEDRISSLPSSLISENILSLLPTKDVVATSVLSTRWKELWTMTSRLNFVDNYLRNPPPPPPDGGDVIEPFQMPLRSVMFVHFLYRVLLLGRFSRMRSFCLHLFDLYEEPLFVNAALASVLKSTNVQRIDLYIHEYQPSIVLPSSLFTSRTLVELKLGAIMFINVPCRVSLPCLKVMLLYGVMFRDGESLTRLLSGCPVLDRLLMKRIVGKNVKLINVSVPSLTMFEVVYLRVTWHDLVADADDEVEEVGLQV